MLPCRFNYPVLNLIINGLPSILKYIITIIFYIFVLNLIINGLPSIQKLAINARKIDRKVLNLIINGLPSIPLK